MDKVRSSTDNSGGNSVLRDIRIEVIPWSCKATASKRNRTYERNTPLAACRLHLLYE